MKKWLIGVTVIILLLVVCSYVFIPERIKISEEVLVNCTPGGAMRILTDENRWKKWWPRNNSTNHNNRSSFKYDGYTYNIDEKLYNAINVTAYNQNSNFKSKIFIIPLTTDSITIRWQSEFLTSTNPFKRIQEYRQAAELKNNMDDILKNLHSFLNKKENIYEFNITNTTLTDTIFIATKILMENCPSTKNIYNLIDDLKKYIQIGGAKEKNYPILNITKTDSGYKTMVAIAIDRELKENKKNFLTRMRRSKNKILTTEVEGGEGTVKRAFYEIENYMSDYNLSAPVIPFEYLVTDRMKEKDTSKWVTRIYYPIR
jgi:hypothetical protein